MPFKEAPKEEEMKAILEFSLPEEQEEFENAQKGACYRGQLDEIADTLRRLRKYSDISQKKPEELLEEITTKFYEITKENYV